MNMRDRRILPPRPRGLRPRSVARAVIVLLATAVAAAWSASALAVALPKPSVSTGGISGLTPTSVILYGALNAKGQPANYVFQYGTTRAYGAQTPLVSGGRSTATIQVNRGVVGLQPYTLYHYRLVVFGAGGTAIGGDRAFKTPKMPLSLQVGASPNPVPFGFNFTVAGTLSGTGNGGRPVALQANPFPYLQGFKALGNAEVTNALGGFSFPVLGMPVNAQLRVVTTSPPFISSPVLVEGVAVRVSFHVHRVHRHRPGRYYRMYGAVAPAEPGARVGFQLLRPGRPSLNVGGTFVRSATPTVSQFATVVKIRHRGVYQALVQVADGSHVSAYSVPIRIR
jgi:hypothetical protein